MNFARQEETEMGLFDVFRKKKPDDGMYDGDGNSCNAEKYYDADVSYRAESALRITVQDVISITGRGTVITGQIESGSIAVGDTVTLRRADGSTREVVIEGLEMFRKMLSTAGQGDNVGVLLRGINRNEVGRGDVLEGR